MSLFQKISNRVLAVCIGLLVIAHFVISTIGMMASDLKETLDSITVIVGIISLAILAAVIYFGIRVFD